jgi:hypothetical protein
MLPSILGVPYSIGAGPRTALRPNCCLLDIVTLILIMAFATAAIALRAERFLHP